MKRPSKEQASLLARIAMKAGIRRVEEPCGESGNRRFSSTGLVGAKVANWVADYPGRQLESGMNGRIRVYDSETMEYVEAETLEELESKIPNANKAPTDEVSDQA